MTTPPPAPASPDRSPVKRPPFPWLVLLSTCSELAGFALIGFVLYLAWWPLPLALLGALLIWIPNRR